MNFKILLYVLIFTSMNNALAQVGKHALIVAIGNYPAAKGWDSISSLKDVPHIRKVLNKQGFENKDIALLADSNATVEGISNALENMVQSLHTGDIAFIHISSHGASVEDDNGDESDGLDESIVTYNAISSKISTNYEKDKENYFRDDLFGNYVERMRDKLGPDGDLIVFIDACYSGTGTRGGVAKVRGGHPALVSSSFNKNKFSSTDTSGIFKEKEQNKDVSKMATYVVFSASAAEEPDRETEGLGALTYAVSKSFAKLSKNATYRSVFANIQIVMNEKVPGQHPVMEGNGIGRKVFGGNIVEQKPYFEIDSVKDNKEITLNGGVYLGLSVGAKVILCAAGTSDPVNAKTMDSGVVVTASNYYCTVKLRKGRIKNSVDAWAFLTQPVYNTEPITVKIIEKTRGATSGYSTDEIMKLKEALKELTMVNYEGEPDLILVKGDKKDSLIVYKNGFLFSTVSKENAGSDLKTRLERYVQYRFLQSLKIVDAKAMVEVRLAPIINGIPDTNAMNPKVINGGYQFCVGDKFMLYVKNVSAEKVFFNILDLQPDGIINPIVPDISKGIYPKDLVLEPGESRLKYTVNIGPPLGNEVFKVFVSTRQIDMISLATSKGIDTRGNKTVLESLVNTSAVISRGGSVDDENVKGESAFDILFQIKEKE